MEPKDDMQSIGELARQAGVSVRTIRYYIDEGLLPQPELRGKYAWFDERYLYRLKLIQQLKDTYLPLREIRTRLEQLTADQVRALAESSEPAAHDTGSRISPAPTSTPAPAPPASATEYLRDMMQEPSCSAPLRMGKIAEEPNLYAPALSSQPEGETWQRISLAPGVELHIKHPLHPSIKAHLRRLVDYARSLFEGHIS